MKRIIGWGLAATAVLSFAGCAKTATEGVNDASARYFDAWVQKHIQPTWQQTALGSYITEDISGTGAVIGAAETTPLVHISYTRKDLDGNILEYTSAETARQMGDYVRSNYYGPVTSVRGIGSMYAGEDEILTGMRIGGTRTAVIPSWLMTYKRFVSADKYKGSAGADDHYIVTVTVHDAFSDILKFQTDSIETYIIHHYPTASLDTTGCFGFYYIQETPPLDETSEHLEGEQLNVNYTGWLLNGQVFDSTDEIVAKDNYLPAKESYGPLPVIWAEDISNMTLDGSTIQATGFARAINQMKAGEKGICIFTSNQGYGSSGSGSTIPAYSPLAFEIEIVPGEE